MSDSGSQAIHDHGFFYLREGEALHFNLHRLAQLTEFTKSKYCNVDNCDCDYSGVHVSLLPKFKSNNNEKQVLQVIALNGLNRTASDEYAAIIEWYYSYSAVNENKFPKSVHQIKALVLSEQDDMILEDCIQAGFSIVPEAILGGDEVRVRNTPEYDFLHYAFELIDRSRNKEMLIAFKKQAKQKSRRGKINWKMIPGLNATSYTSAINKIIQTIRDQYLNGQILVSALRNLVSLLTDIILYREDKFNKLISFRNFNVHSHRFTIKFWESQHETLQTLLKIKHLGEERDDLVVDVEITKFENTLTFLDHLSDFIAKLIVPMFLTIVLIYFWNRR